MMLMVNTRKKNNTARLQIALQYELSLYHFTPETRRAGLFITKRASVLLNNSSMVRETERNSTAELFGLWHVCDGLLKSTSQLRRGISLDSRGPPSFPHATRKREQD